MKRILSIICILAALALGQSGHACVGKTLYIGVVNSPDELLFAEMISILVTERTGTAVKIKAFRDAGEIYGAVKKGEVGVFVEEPGRALKILARPQEGNPKAAYESARKESRKSLNLVWLEPFGVKRYYAPVLSLETIGNLPALPKLINKLGGVVSDETCGRLLRSAKGEQQVRKTARDFLKSRKLI